MNIVPIRTAANHKGTLKEIATLMESDPELGTPDGDRLDVLVTLVQAYEAKHALIGVPDPVEAIKFRMAQSGLSVKDMEPIIGKSNRVYEVHKPQTASDAGDDPPTAPHAGHSGRRADCGYRHRVIRTGIANSRCLCWLKQVWG